MKKFSRSKRPVLRAFSLLVTLACAGMAQAQTAPAPPSYQVALQTVVVSGSRAEQLQSDLPFSMDVISADEREDAQMNDIRDLARELPNVSVKRAPARFTVTGAGNPTGRDANAGFNVRGLDGNRVLMLVDGMRLPRSYINGNNAFGRDSLSLDLFKRVELVRGPSSVLYGSDGLAGLVNFISYEPADFLLDRHGTPKALGGKLSAGTSGDDQGSSLAATVAARASDNLQWLVTASGHQAFGLDNRGTNDAANVDRTRPNPQMDQGQSLLGKLVFQPSAAQKHVLTLEAVHKDSQVELLSSRAKPALVASSVVGESTAQTLQRTRLTWDARYRMDTLWADQLQPVLSAQNSASQDNGHTQRFDGGVRVRNTSYDESARQLSVQASKAMTLSTQWSQKLTYGLDLSRTDISSWFGGSDPAPLPVYVPKKYFPDTRDASSALYAQSELGDARWSITSGLRFEQFSLQVLTQDGFAPPSPTPGKSLSGSNVSPKLGALWRATAQWSVYGNYASGFRAPNSAQVNGFTENPTPTTFVKLLPNPDLSPETSRNVELGVRARMERLSLDAAVFSGDFQHLIVDKKPMGGSGTAGDPLVFQTVNIDSATIRGFELKATLDWGDLGGGTLSTPLAYGQTRGTNQAAHAPLNSIDPSKLVLGLKYQTASWDLRLDATQHGAKNEGDLESPYIPKSTTKKQFTVAGATTLDLLAQWRVHRDLRVNLGVANLSNRKYWLWSDVQGLAASSTVLDAYTQPGRHLNLSMVMDY